MIRMRPVISDHRTLRPQTQTAKSPTRPLRLSLIEERLAQTHCSFLDTFVLVRLTMASDDALPLPHPRNCPSRVEVLLHKGVIQNLEEDENRTDSEIRRLMHKAARLRAHRRLLQRRKANHTSYISPLRRLPPEILSEIVYMCLYDDVKLTTLTQICGTLREVVLGMSALWNQINLFTVRLHSKQTYPLVSDSSKYFIRRSKVQQEPLDCRTQEQLEVFLARAGSRPLHIQVEYPPASHLLQFLSSRSHPISSLSLCNWYRYDPSGIWGHPTLESYPRSVQYEDVKGLNLRSLEKLVLHSVSSKEAEMLMDLALQSTREKIILHLEYLDTLEQKILKHDLINRTSELFLSSGEFYGTLYEQTDENYQDIYSGHTLSNIVLPKFKRLSMTGDQDSFDALDFRDSGALKFHGSYSEADDYHIIIDILSLPEGVMGISLYRFEWSQKPARPRRFEDLTHLQLESMLVDGMLGEYISAPNLKHLVLIGNVSSEPESLLVENRRWNRVLCDTRFLQATPLLETIKLMRGHIDKRAVEGLKSCTLLKTLAIEQCDISHFVLPLLDSSQSNRLLPSLEIFDIKNSWPTDLDMTFEEFRQRFMVHRPNVVLSNHTDKEYPPAPLSPLPSP
jgi:hypothetical protein